jgi:hypothetical protein
MTIFDCSAAIFNPSFGAGLLPPEAPTDAYGNKLPWGPSEADLAEYREWLAEREEAEAIERDREDTMAALRAADEAARWERLEELEALAGCFA